MFDTEGQKLVLHTHKVKLMDMQDFLAASSWPLLAFPAPCLVLLGMKEQGLFSLGFGCNLLASAELEVELPVVLPSSCWMHQSQAGGSPHTAPRCQHLKLLQLPL